MATTQSRTDDGIGLQYQTDTSATTTAVNDVAFGPCKIHAVILNKASATNAAHYKMYDNIKPTEGDTNPIMIMKVANGEDCHCIIDPPLQLDNGLSYGAAEEAGDDMTTVPDGAVTVNHAISK